MTKPLVAAPLLEVCTALRDLRTSRNMTLGAVAAATAFSVTKVQRMETGQRGLNVEDVAVLLGHYQAPEAQREHLLAVVAAPLQPGWWRSPGVRIPEDWREAIALEDEAMEIREYAHGVIPALLQTSAYAGALLRVLHPGLDEVAVSHLVSARMTHQAMLTQAAAPRLHCLIEESALLRVVGGPVVHAEQLQVLAACFRRPNVVVRVVPLDSGAHPGLRGSLSMLQFDRVPPMARMAGGVKFVSDKRVVRRACTDWAGIERVTLPPEETTELLEKRTNAALARMGRDHLRVAW